MPLDRMRVIVFGPWPPPYGGVASHVRDLTSSLAARGVPTRMLGYGDFWMRPGLCRVSVSRQDWWRTKLWMRLALSSGALLHDHSGLLPNPEEDLLESFASIVRARRARWVLTLHDETLIHRFHLWPTAKQDVFARFVEIPDYIICVSAHLRRFLAELGIRENRMESIPSLLPMEPIPETRLPREVAVFLQQHRPLLATVGAFHANYDLLGIAEALPAILADYPQAGLVVIDPGFASDEPYRRSVREALERAGRSAYLVTSRLPRGQVFAILRASSVFIRGARYDAFGTSKVEAILAGTPVVTTETGQTRHMRIYRYGTPADLSEVVCDTLRQPPDLGEAQQFYRGTAEQALDQILAVYERVVC